MSQAMGIRLLRALMSALLAVLSSSGAAFAQSAPVAVLRDPPPQQEEAAVSGDGCRTVARLAVNFLRATVGIFNGANLKPAIVGTAATGLAGLYDQQIAEALEDPDSTLGTPLETGGAPRWSGAVVGVLFVSGRFARGTRLRAASYDWLEAYLVNLAYTEAVKTLVGRTRPNGQDDESFPSGHASNAFALAAVADRHYGWKIGVPAYSAAAVVSVSRLQQNAHYLSDVLAGATLGFIVGRTVVRVNNHARCPGKTQVNASPVLARNARAVVVQVSWR